MRLEVRIAIGLINISSYENNIIGHKPILELYSCKHKEEKNRGYLYKLETGGGEQGK